MSTKLTAVSFRSKKTRAPNPLLETSDSVGRNDEFDVLFRFTDIDHSVEKERHLVILVNGFAESSTDLYHMPQVGIADLLASRGVSTALLPLPFHLGRLAPTGKLARLARLAVKMAPAPQPPDAPLRVMPAYLVSNYPERLYAGYRQVISDVAELARQIRNSGGNGAAYARWFDGSTKMHLLGYSLGGLGCLASFLKRRVLVDRGEETDSLFETCCLLSSGSNFLDLVPPEVGFDSDQWDKIREYYYSRHFELARDEFSKGLEGADSSTQESLRARLANLDVINVRGLSYRFFEELVLGVWNSKVLERYSSRVLAILGMSDPVVRPDTILNVRPRDRRFTAIHLPSLSHDVIRTECWQEWCNYVADCIVRFLECHPSKGPKGDLAVRDQRRPKRA